MPLFEKLPSPTTVSREIPEAAESAGRLPGLCLLPMLITAADMWPCLRGYWPQHWGQGKPSPGERPGLPKEGRREEWEAGDRKAGQEETPRETDGARLVSCRHGDWETLKTGRQTV